MTIVKKNMVLGVVCVGVFFAVSAVAMGVGPSDAPEPNSDRTYTRKGGDLWVVWYGSTYRSRSARPGSMYNRSFRGGGLHGGK